MNVAILQSNYIPWKGYFDVIHDVDLFVFYDDVQYTRRDWRNRNRIKTPRGAEWLTIPTDGDREHLICEVRMVDPRWQENHWRTIRSFYGKAPFFDLYRERLEALYLGTDWTHLSAFNQEMTKVIARELLGIRTEFTDSRLLGAVGAKQDRILDLLEKTAADRYVSGPAAKTYLDADVLASHGIEVVWKDYAGYPEYPQFHPPFAHDVTILDLLFHCGPDAPGFIWGWREVASTR
jgi:hypothetical protein